MFALENNFIDIKYFPCKVNRMKFSAEQNMFTHKMNETVQRDVESGSSLQNSEFRHNCCQRYLLPEARLS